jgi:hypothetical protein
MHMLRKLVRRVLYFLVGLAVVGGILFAFGLRVVFEGGGGLYLAFTKSAEKHAAEIEKHREAQRAQGPPPAPAPVRLDPATASPVASPTAAKPSPAAIKPSTYWTNFRGPDRNGHYRQQRVRTDWRGPLAPLWKQPVGGGYASFVIAEGRAFTIEQRGARELAAAYDLVTGRELWTSAWNWRVSGRFSPSRRRGWSVSRLRMERCSGNFRGGRRTLRRSR